MMRLNVWMMWIVAAAVMMTGGGAGGAGSGAGVESGGPAGIDEPAHPPQLSQEQLGTVELTRIRISGVVNLQNRQVNRYMNIEGQVNLKPDVQAIGVIHGAMITQVIDGRGVELMSAEDLEQMRAMREQRSFSNLMRQSGVPQIRLSAHVRNLERLPTHLSRVRGETIVLVADRIDDARITPLTVGRLSQVNPDLRIQITDLRHEGDRLTVTFEYESASHNPFFNPNTPPPFVSDMRLIDDEHNVLTQQGFNVNVTGVVDGVERGEGKLAFPLPDARKPASLSVEVVSHVSERSIRFDLRDIELPGDDEDGPVAKGGVEAAPAEDE